MKNYTIDEQELESLEFKVRLLETSIWNVEYNVENAKSRLKEIQDYLTKVRKT